MQPITIPAAILASASREFGASDVNEFFEQQCAAAGTSPDTPAAWPEQIHDLAARLCEASRDAKLTPAAQARFIAAAGGTT